MIASKTLYLTADRQNVVNEGDSKAQFLLVREGQELPDALAEKYGVKGGKSAPEAAATAPAGSPQPQNREADIAPRTRSAKASRKS